MNLTNLTRVDLYHNGISDLTPLVKLTKVELITLMHNQISNVSPLLSLSGLDPANAVDLRGNPLSETSINVYIPQLEQRGLHIIWDPPATP